MDLLDDDRLLDLRRRAPATDPAAVIAEERGNGVGQPQENDALRTWKQPGQPAAASTEASAAPGRALCPICGIRPARQRCNSCNRVVCPADVWTMLGLCKGCASADDVAHWHKPAAPEPKNWLGGAR